MMGDQSYCARRSVRKRFESSKFKKALYVVAGTVSLGLGCIGIVLPVLPTTPFLLLSAACYYKGSERLHSWMLSNRWFGDYIRNYREGKGIPLKTKIFTLSLLWVVISYSAIFMLNILIVQIVLVGIAIGVSIHIVTLPTLHRT